MIFSFLASLGQCILLLGYFTACGILLNGVPDAWNSNLVMALYYVLIPAVVSIVYVFILRAHEKKQNGSEYSAIGEKGVLARAVAVILFLAMGYALGISSINEGMIWYFLCNFSLYIIVALFAVVSILVNFFVEHGITK